MKQATLLVLSLFVAGSVAAQSLVELADKEKKRREESRAEGKTVKVYSDEDGMRGKADEESDPSSEPEGTATDSEKGDRPEDSIEWKGIYGGYKVRYLYLENKMKMLDEQEEKWCSPPPLGSDRANWASEQARYRSRCQGVRDDQKKLRAEMQAMESECLAEAKRHGVLPGNARLGR